MEFYRLDYSLAIFKPETNLKGGKVDRSELAKKAKIAGGEARNEPLLLQMLNGMMSGGFAAAGPLEEVKKIEPLSLQELPPSKTSATKK